MSPEAMKRKFLLYFLSLFTLIGGGCAFGVQDDCCFFEDDPGFFTIQEAIDFSEPGDTVFIESGVYSPSTNGESFPIFMKNGVNLEGQDPNNTFIDAEGFDTVFAVIGYNSGTISNFTLTNGQGNLGGGVFVENSSGTLENLRVIGNQAFNLGSGIYVTNSNGLTLRNIVVSDNSSGSSTDAPAQVEIFGSNVNFFNNVVAMGDNDGVILDEGSGGNYENNIFYQNGSGGFGAGFADLDDTTVANIQYNITFNNAEGDYFLNGELLSSTEANALFPDDQIANNFSVDPLFQDPFDNNFFLASGSPAFNAGNPDPGFNNSDGSRNTIGAYGGPAADF
jgi:Protein of unknown function (DUF1565).